MSEELITEGMLDLYLYENGQLLEQLEQMTLDMKEKDGLDETKINEFFRIMHTIKGASGVMKYDEIMRLSHKLEDVFYYMRESHPENVPHMELIEYILKVGDFITNEFDKIRNGLEPDGKADELVTALDSFLQELKGRKYHYYSIVIYYRNDTMMCNIRAYTAVHALEEYSQKVEYQPNDILTNEDTADYILEYGFNLLAMTTIGEEKLRTLLDSSGVEMIDIEECDEAAFSRGFVPQSTEITVDHLEIEMNSEQENSKKSQDKADQQSELLNAPCIRQSQALMKKKEKTPIESFISVNVSKVDALMDLIGEIVIAQSVVLQNNDLKVPGLNLNNFKKAAAQLTKFTSELQDVIMSMRMTSVNRVFQKMKRICFDTSQKLNKEVELVIVGENTELDKNIIEHISDPLMHMIRNAVDHGIEESVEERMAAGKPEKGIITLEARNEGGKVIILVKDDGRGMNPAKLFQKAQKNGLIPMDKRQEDYTTRELFQFITYPGFSISEKVTEVSGRGVGMDVVAKNIQSIGGILEIDSVEGKGTTMMIKIPLTLAIINGILLRVGNMTYALETGVIQEFIRIQKDQLIIEPNGVEYVSIREHFYSVIRLSDRYHMEGAVHDVEEGIMILAEHEEKRVCIFVDQLIGEQEIVVKPIPPYIKKVEGLSGCTQLGDGSIALILDVGGLLQ